MLTVSPLPRFREIADANEIKLLETALPACLIGYESLFDESRVVSPHAEAGKSVVTANDAMLPRLRVSSSGTTSLWTRRNGTRTEHF